MKKQYIFLNSITGEGVGFNANSLQQARIKMRRVAKYRSVKTGWSFHRTDVKIPKCEWWGYLGK